MDSLKNFNFGLNYFVDQGDQRVKKWPLMQTPLPGWVLIGAYLYFVKVAGPQWMKRRQPYDIRNIMILYNFAMVFVNLALSIGIGYFVWFSGYSLLCQPVDYSNAYDAVMMAKIGWCYYITKFVEFADTIFFVLRKKQSHVSALHVIHHSSVPFVIWFGIKYAPGGFNFFFPFLNSLVHVVMYTYYGVAALGPQYQKYLFWKKYTTFIQMGQFVIVLIHAISFMYKCDVGRGFVTLNILFATLFLTLFYNYFKVNYCKRDTSSSKLTTEATTNGNFNGVDNKDDSVNSKVYRKHHDGLINRSCNNVVSCR